MGFWYGKDKNSAHFKNVFKKDKNIVDSSMKFGECIVRTDWTQIKAKLKNQGQVLYWLGHATNHPKGIYRVYNAETQHAVLSRDSTPLNETPKQQTKQNKEPIASPVASNTMVQSLIRAWKEDQMIIMVIKIVIQTKMNYPIQYSFVNIRWTMRLVWNSKLQLRVAIILCRDLVEMNIGIGRVKGE